MCAPDQSTNEASADGEKDDDAYRRDANKEDEAPPGRIAASGNALWVGVEAGARGVE